MKRQLATLLTALLLLPAVLCQTALAATGYDWVNEQACERVGQGDPDLPYWYPADPGHFRFYSDPYAPRVVDDAGIFTDEEEAAILKQIEWVAENFDKDVVVFTDNTTYGMERSVYAADFYDFNGYGYGDGAEGLCLFVCMESGNRGWWCVASGDETRALYTEANANALDDALEEYMVAGDYAEGVENWAYNVGTLYDKGIPFAPDWYPSVTDNFERFHDASAPRVIDEAGRFTSDQIETLEDQAAKLADKHGLDVVILISSNSYGMSRRDYMEAFYTYNGYGYGDNYDGLMLGLFPYSGRALSYASGAGTEHFTEVNENRLSEQSEKLMESNKDFQAAELWLHNIDSMQSKGRVPRTMMAWLMSTGLAALGGLVTGGTATANAKRKMVTPKAAVRADEYMKSGSFRLQNVSDRFMGTTVTRTYSPRQKSSGGGRSSYSGGYSGHSGRSHSGSGRSF